MKDCIICDIDGTLAHRVDRDIYDYDKVKTDKCDETIKDLIWQYKYSDVESEVLLVSGRYDSCKRHPMLWLKPNGIVYDELYMGTEGDHRKDTEIKKEIYEKYIKDKYNVLFVLDDRDCCVKLWRDLGFKCLQVAYGNF